nr:hypothetical protein [Nitrosomonas sp. Nm58]
MITKRPFSKGQFSTILIGKLDYQIDTYITAIHILLVRPVSTRPYI